jgi:hypothetical protein
MFNVWDKGIWEAMEKLNTLVDDSDPDVCYLFLQSFVLIAGFLLLF